MSKYFGVDGKKVGKVGGEKYYIDKGENIVQKSNKYYPVNSTLLKRKKFKEYVLSLFDEGIPQIYVLDELPEELYPYALLFVKNGEENYKVYVDKEEVRTEIKLGENDYDAVDIVNNVPEEPRNNTVYFVNQPENKNKEKNVAEYEIYVCDNDELKKIELKGTDIPELEQIKQVVNDVINYSLKNAYNTNLPAGRIVSTNADGAIQASNLDAVTTEYILTTIPTGSLKNIYYKTVTADRVMLSNSSGYLTTSSYTSTTANNVITGVSTKSLKNFYNATAKTNRMIISDPSGYLVASSMLHTDVSNVVYSVLQNCLKNIFNQNLAPNKDIVTDDSGFLTTSEKPHLYAHHFFYDKAGMGEVNFVIYSPKSTELYNSEYGAYLESLGCTANYRAYPANGQSQATGGIVTGVYVVKDGHHMFPYNLWVASYTIGGAHVEPITNYPDNKYIYITQIY